VFVADVSNTSSRLRASRHPLAPAFARWWRNYQQRGMLQEQLEESLHLSSPSCCLVLGGGGGVLRAASQRRQQQSSLAPSFARWWRTCQWAASQRRLAQLHGADSLAAAAPLSNSRLSRAFGAGVVRQASAGPVPRSSSLRSNSSAVLAARQHSPGKQDTPRSSLQLNSSAALAAQVDSSVTAATTTNSVNDRNCVISPDDGCCGAYCPSLMDKLEPPGHTSKSNDTNTNTNTNTTNNNNNNTSQNPSLIDHMQQVRSLGPEVAGVQLQTLVDTDLCGSCRHLRTQLCSVTAERDKLAASLAALGQSPLARMAKELGFAEGGASRFFVGDTESEYEADYFPKVLRSTSYSQCSSLSASLASESKCYDSLHFAQEEELLDAEETAAKAEPKHYRAHTTDSDYEADYCPEIKNNNNDNNSNNNDHYDSLHFAQEELLDAKETAAKGEPKHYRAHTADSDYEADYFPDIKNNNDNNNNDHNDSLHFAQEELLDAEETAAKGEPKHYRAHTTDSDYEADYFPDIKEKNQSNDNSNNDSLHFAQEELLDAEETAAKAEPKHYRAHTADSDYEADYFPDIKNNNNDNNSNNDHFDSLHFAQEELLDAEETAAKGEPKHYRAHTADSDYEAYYFPDINQKKNNNDNSNNNKNNNNDNNSEFHRPSPCILRDACLTPSTAATDDGELEAGKHEEVKARVAWLQLVLFLYFTVICCCLFYVILPLLLLFSILRCFCRYLRLFCFCYLYFEP
ncbi:unnamed protein product, partial [Polarella glacialis]